MAQETNTELGAQDGIGDIDGEGLIDLAEVNARRTPNGWSWPSRPLSVSVFWYIELYAKSN